MSTKSTVKANYTPEMIATIVADYQAGKGLQDIADATGKTVASIRAKLASLKVYKAAEKPAGKKAGLTKEKIVEDIAAIVSGDRTALESLKAATIADLNSLLAFLVQEMREDAGMEKLPE